MEGQISKASGGEIWSIPQPDSSLGELVARGSLEGIPSWAEVLAAQEALRTNKAPSLLRRT
ncbi:hypothetical protein MJO29_010250 [Puccinia striiformis f. sp. tritici]|nr:hypothetical protein MJO29_010250 [Puccinia striiformis f. sp. tritici]